MKYIIRFQTGEIEDKNISVSYVEYRSLLKQWFIAYFLFRIQALDLNIFPENILKVAKIIIIITL